MYCAENTVFGLKICVPGIYFSFVRAIHFTTLSLNGVHDTVLLCKNALQSTKNYLGSEIFCAVAEFLLCCNPGFSHLLHSVDEISRLNPVLCCTQELLCCSVVIQNRSY